MRLGARVPPESILALTLRGTVLGDGMLHGLIRLTELGGSASVDALVVRQAPGLDALIALAGSDAGAAPALRGLLADPERAIRLLGKTSPAGLRHLIDAAEQDVAFVDELLARMPIDPAAPLDALAEAGTTRLLRVAAKQADRAALLERLAPYVGDPARLTPLLHDLASATDGEVAGFLQGRAPTPPVTDPAAVAASIYSARRQLLARGPMTITTATAFTVGPVPVQGTWSHLARPDAWLPARQALHGAYLAEAVASLKRMAEALRGQPPTLYAMRGNTAAGKTRAIRGVGGEALPELAQALRVVGDDLHITVNPDNAKIVLLRDGADLGLTSQQVHDESSVLAERLTDEAFALRNADGTPASLLLDRRLLTVKDVKAMAKRAKETGRRFVLIDVDAPLEMSLVGVLIRDGIEQGPVPDFKTIAKDGFVPARENRQAVADFMTQPGGATPMASGRGRAPPGPRSCPRPEPAAPPRP